MTGKRKRRLRRLVNRAARKWAHHDTVTAAEWRRHLWREARRSYGDARDVEEWTAACS